MGEDWAGEIFIRNGEILGWGGIHTKLEDNHLGRRNIYVDK